MEMRFCTNTKTLLCYAYIRGWSRAPLDNLWRL